MHEPDGRPQLPAVPDGAQERIDGLVDRCEDLFGYRDRERVQGLIHRHGPDRVEAAIAVAERRSPRPSSLGFLKGILSNWQADGVEVRPPGRPRRVKATPRENYNPGPKYAPVPPSERPSRDWRSLVASLEAGDAPATIPMPEIRRRE